MNNTNVEALVRGEGAPNWTGYAYNNRQQLACRVPTFYAACEC